MEVWSAKTHQITDERVTFGTFISIPLIKNFQLKEIKEEERRITRFEF